MREFVNTRESYIQAVQIPVPGSLLPEEDADWLQVRGIYGSSDGSYVVTSSTEIYEAKPGDWVVEEAGILLVLRPWQFHHLHPVCMPESRSERPINKLLLGLSIFLAGAAVSLFFLQ